MNNKDKYIDTLRSFVHRDGIEDLISFLESSDFFTAPASAVYHNNFEGGLCEHSLNVFNNALTLSEIFCPQLDAESVALVALLHDLAKIDYYEKYIANVKVYSPSGSKFDSAGRFDWEQKESYKVKNVRDREYVYGEHGMTSVLIIMKYIKLTDDEVNAIVNHHLTMDTGKPRTDITEILNRTPLATILCLADQVSAYITENPYVVNE